MHQLYSFVGMVLGGLKELGHVTGPFDISCEFFPGVLLGLQQDFLEVASILNREIPVLFRASLFKFFKATSKIGFSFL